LQSKAIGNNRHARHGPPKFSSRKTKFLFCVKLIVDTAFAGGYPTYANTMEGVSRQKAGEPNQEGEALSPTAEQVSWGKKAGRACHTSLRIASQSARYEYTPKVRYEILTLQRQVP
jgi:hypothetical protein